MKAFTASTLDFRKHSPQAITPQSNLSSEEESDLFQQWDEDLKRGATFNARLANLDADDAFDLAQEARIKVLSVFRRRKIINERYIRVVIKNSMLTARTRLRNIREGGREVKIADRLTERIIKNPFVFSIEPETSVQQEKNDSSPDESAGYDDAPIRIRQKELPPPSDEADIMAVTKIRKWLEKLPGNLRAIYEALYVAGLSQREVAANLKISQPRVAQLHQQLLAQGKQDLASLIA